MPYSRPGKLLFTAYGLARGWINTIPVMLVQIGVRVLPDQIFYCA
jgi:hypothetical protein